MSMASALLTCPVPHSRLSHQQTVCQAAHRPISQRQLVLKPEVAQNGHRADIEQSLERLGRLVMLRPGYYAVFVRRDGVGGAVDTMMANLEGALDDFRLAPPSLEDVYIHLAGQKLTVEEV